MQIHWLAMIAAAVAGFAVGGIWYGPLFGKAWMAARGIAKEDTAGMNMPLIFGSTFLTAALAVSASSLGLTCFLATSSARPKAS